MTVDVRRVVDAVWRMESAKLIAALTRVTGDVGLAEELAQDALVAALERWPESGVPDKPGAWLTATAKHRADRHLPAVRAAHPQDRRARPGARAAGGARSRTGRAALDEVVEDDLLRLVFISCHPVLSREARVALTLRLLGGLTTDEIARAFLVPESTVAQRIVRAKRTLAAARVPFEVPTGPEFTGRLASVLEVLYLVFNEGYAATAGEHWTRPALCQEALRLGPHPGRADAGGVGGARPGGPDGDPGVAAAGAGRPERRAGAADRPGPRPVGPRAHHPRARRPRPRRARPARRSARTRCRPRSPPATPAPARWRPPTGRGSPPSTRRSPS